MMKPMIVLDQPLTKPESQPCHNSISAMMSKGIVVTYLRSIDANFIICNTPRQDHRSHSQVLRYKPDIAAD